MNYMACWVLRCWREAEPFLRNVHGSVIFPEKMRQLPFGHRIVQSALLAGFFADNLVAQLNVCASSMSQV